MSFLKPSTAYSEFLCRPNPEGNHPIRMLVVVPFFDGDVTPKRNLEWAIELDGMSRSAAFALVRERHVRSLPRP